MRLATLCLLLCVNAFAWQRDWGAQPAVAELAGFHGRLFVVGDVHGEYRKYLTLLRRAGLVKGDSDNPHWAGENAVLVQLGDLIDKGHHALPAIDLTLRLASEAAAVGGKVIAVAGNHELAFLADPYSKKSEEFRDEVRKAGLSLMSDVYRPESKYGAWFRNLPAAALVGGIYLSHSGWANGLRAAEISERYRRAIESEAWDSPFTCGDHAAHPSTAGFFNANAWWLHGAPFEQQLARLGVNQVIFGHDPGAFHAKGEIAAYFGDNRGRALIKADVGMVKGDSDGVIYRCEKWLPGGGCARHEILSLDDRGGKFQALKTHDHAPDFEAPPTPRDGC